MKSIENLGRALLLFFHSCFNLLNKLVCFVDFVCKICIILNTALCSLNNHADC